MRHSTFKGEVEIDYVLRKSTSASEVLVISFPGAGGDRFRADSLGLGYMMTIGQFNVNALYIKSSREDFVRALFVGFKDDHSIERTLLELVKFSLKETGANRCVCIGSSLGGNTALYYGLKYNWDIISGGARAPKSWYVGGLIHELISKAQENGFDKSVYMCWGRGEPMWRNQSEAPSLVKKFEENNVNKKVELFQYSVHANISKVFPSIIGRELNILLGNESGIEKTSSQPTAAELTGETTSLLKQLKPFSDKLDQIKPNYSIHQIENFGEADPERSLEIFVYAAQGYHWLPKRSKPKKFDSAEYWQTVARSNPQYANSMAFQSAALNHFKATGDISALELVHSSISDFLALRDEDKTTHRKHKRWWTTQLRTVCLLDFASIILDPQNEHRKKVPSSLIGKIVENTDWEAIKGETILAFRRAIHTEILLTDVQESYSRLSTLVLISEFFKNDAEFHEAVRSKVVDLANKISDYYFDYNGVCIYGQTLKHHEAATQFRKFVDILEANTDKPNRRHKKLVRKLDLVETVSRYMTRDDGRMPNIGHSDIEHTKSEPATGSLINLSSNFAVLSERGAYITIGGGSNINSPYRHCDLLSFTFRYQGRQIIWDAGGGKEDLADYARSAVAHSAFFCDEIDYVTPDYPDWTTLEDFTENENYVLVIGKHMLIEGVTLTRAWLWIKPNILIIWDNAKSTSERLFTQNFLFPKLPFSEMSSGGFKFNDRKNGTSYTIQQIPTESNYRFRSFFGTNNSKAPESKMRGSRIEAFTRLKPITNFAYEVKGTNANLLTVIEAKSGKSSEAEFVSAEVQGEKIKATAKVDGENLNIEEELNLDLRIFNLTIT
jgi:hypothetical protein